MGQLQLQRMELLNVHYLEWVSVPLNQEGEGFRGLRASLCISLKSAEQQSSQWGLEGDMALIC
mgnify:CR=1 FL=1